MSKNPLDVNETVKKLLEDDNFEFNIDDLDLSSVVREEDPYFLLQEAASIVNELRVKVAGIVDEKVVESVDFISKEIRDRLNELEENHNS